MSKKSFLIIIFLLISIPINLFYLYLSSSLKENQGSVAGIENNYNNVINSVSIGEYRFTLFGYTSPFAEVSFSGQGIADQTTADKNGYFEFKNRFSPFSPREACLSAKDQFGRISSPVCLPPFPVQYNVKIGPIIMPPTISVDKNNYFVGDEIILTGQTIPDEQVNLSVFTSKLKKGGSLTKIIPVIKNVEAFSIPKITTKSDNKGNFSVSLPSSSAQAYRLFTQVGYKNNYSPHSLLLKIKVEPLWMIIIKFFGLIFNFIKPRILEIIIIGEIIALLIYFIKIILHPYYLKNKRSIVLYQSILPEIKPQASLLNINNN